MATDKAYNSALIQIQKLANTSAENIQKMVNKSNTEQMTFNSAEAQKARDWQEKMSKSAHQMEVADLKKAGLNPVLSANSGGAQSYTTSSASTDNDSGASAASGILGQQLGAISSMESSRMTSEAQVKAAKTNAIAVKRAAETSAYAQRYAAQMNYLSNKYRVDNEAKQAELNRQNQRWIVKNQNATSWAAFLDKNLRNSGVYKGLSKVGKQVFKSGFSYGNKQLLMKNSSDYFANKKGTTITKKNFKLSTTGKQFVDNQLNNIGVSATKVNRSRYIKALIFNDKKSLSNLLYLGSNSWSTRPGRR